MDLNKIKRFVAESAMENEGDLMIVVDRHTQGVELPPNMGDFVTLTVGNGLTPPIPDLWVDDEGIVATLTFSTGEFQCKIPWQSVCFMSDGNVLNMIGFPHSGQKENE